jgi:hypothetical protein
LFCCFFFFLVFCFSQCPPIPRPVDGGY